VLTPREWEVLELVRRGLTNPEIAARLAISERGVKYHVSEIIGKLGVADRRAAARWQPDAEIQRDRSPLWSSPTIHWRAALHPAAMAGVLGVALAGVLVAAVAWGPLPVQTDRNRQPEDPASSAAPTNITLTSEHPGVMLFTIGVQPSVQELDAQGTAFLQWVDAGSRLVGYSWTRQDFEILEVETNGTVREQAAFAPQPLADRRGEWAQALPGGRTILVEGDNSPPRLYDIATAAMHPFAGPSGQNTSFTASSDGAHLMFNNTVDGETRVMTSDPDGGNAQVVAGDATSSIGLTGENPLSPDGSHRLMETSDRIGSPGPSTDIVIDGSGRAVWRMPVPDIVSTAIATEVRWAGPGRLLLTQTQPNGHDALNVITSKFIAIPSGVETAATA
jgi:DNA-binding CsgD family transcriptional regulator